MTIYFLNATKHDTWKHREVKHLPMFAEVHRMPCPDMKLKKEKVMIRMTVIKFFEC